MNEIKISAADDLCVIANLYESEYIEYPVFILCHQTGLPVASILKRRDICLSRALPAYRSSSAVVAK